MATENSPLSLPSVPEIARDVPVDIGRRHPAPPDALAPEQLSVLSVLWSRDTPLTIGNLTRLTGMCHAEVQDSIGVLRARRLVQALNTVVASYRPAVAPEARR